VWNRSQLAVESVIPTLIQEIGANAKPIEAKVKELAALSGINLSEDECAEILKIGDNKGCMSIKGGNPEHEGDPMPDRWSLTPDLEAIGQRWGIDPRQDLVCTHKVVA
jgi:hypothetical protein